MPFSKKGKKGIEFLKDSECTVTTASHWLFCFAPITLRLLTRQKKVCCLSAALDDILPGYEDCTFIHIGIG